MDNTLNTNENSKKLNTPPTTPVTIPVQPASDAEEELRRELFHKAEHDAREHYKRFQLWKGLDGSPFQGLPPLEPLPQRLPRKLVQLDTPEAIKREMHQVYRDFHYRRIPRDEFSSRMYGLKALVQIVALQQMVPAQQDAPIMVK